MKIIVLGATGGTGKNVVDKALAAGHEVVAVARKPETVAARERLTVHKGDVLDAASLAPAFVGADAVICAIGPAQNGKPGTLISEGTKNMLENCAKAKVPRVVFESGMICSDGKELSLAGRFAIFMFGAIYPKLRADKFIAEASIRASAADWVIVRPPALDHSPATGKYLAGPGARISRAARSRTATAPRSCSRPRPSRSGSSRSSTSAASEQRAPLLNASPASKGPLMKTKRNFGFGLGLALAVSGLTACGTPAMSSAMRANFPAEWHLEGYCLTVGRGSIENVMKERYAQGWRLAYVSEYTSTARAGNPSIMCFERPAK